LTAHARKVKQSEDVAHATACGDLDDPPKGKTADEGRKMATELEE
jgi:hypothetical protein